MFTRRQIAIGALVFGTATSLTIPRSFAQKDEEAAVAAVVEALRQAMIAADRDKLEALVADQLSYGHSTGAIETKQEFINNIVGKKSVYKSIKQTDQTITLAGDVAIVRHVFSGCNCSPGFQAGLRTDWPDRHRRMASSALLPDLVPEAA